MYKRIKIILIILIFTSFVIDINPYLFENDLYILINQTITNFAGIPILSLLYILIRRETRLKEFFLTALMATVGLIIYEFLQIFLFWLVFDIKDIYASLLGFFLFMFFITLLNFKKVYKNIHKLF